MSEYNTTAHLLGNRGYDYGRNWSANPGDQEYVSARTPDYNFEQPAPIEETTGSIIVDAAMGETN